MNKEYFSNFKKDISPFIATIKNPMPTHKNMRKTLIIIESELHFREKLVFLPQNPFVTPAISEINKRT